MTTHTARIHIDAATDLQVAGYPTTDRWVDNLRRALRRGVAAYADAAGINVDYVPQPEATDALGRAVWAAVHAQITLGPRGGCTVDLAQLRIDGARRAREGYAQD